MPHRNISVKISPPTLLARWQRLLKPHRPDLAGVRAVSCRRAFPCPALTSLGGASSRRRQVSLAGHSCTHPTRLDFCRPDLHLVGPSGSLFGTIVFSAACTLLLAAVVSLSHGRLTMPHGVCFCISYLLYAAYQVLAQRETFPTLCVWGSFL